MRATLPSLAKRPLGEGQRQNRGFTLVELMVVCGVIALVLTISVPAIYRQLHPESMQRTVRELMEICGTARAQAILSGATSELVINTVNRTISVGAASAPSGGIQNRLDSPDVSGQEWRMGQSSRPASSAGADGALSSITLPEGVRIEGIRLNFLDYTEDEMVRVRFYPNGTSDEFSLFLLSEKGERRQVFLEVVTGYADFESDPMKFR